MNTKRQTIWMVSMLSIMVVLSAYYLFTDDVNEMKVASDELANYENGVALDSTTDTGEIAEGTAGLDQTKTDEEILQEVNATQNSDFGHISNLHLQRMDALKIETDKIYATIVEGDSEAMTKAYNELSLIEDRESILTDLEAMLRVDYEDAIIIQEENKWKVLVQTDKLEKSEAVSIMDLVMNQMKIGNNQIVVQMVKY